MRRNRQHNTRLAFHLRRLRLSVGAAARLLRMPYGTVKNWKQGRSSTPRAALRLLAAWRLLHWDNFKLGDMTMRKLESVQLNDNQQGGKYLRLDFSDEWHVQVSLTPGDSVDAVYDQLRVLAELTVRKAASS